MKKIMTYGTFDLLHFGHIVYLKEAKKLGNYLIVGLSSDEFNKIKGKKSFFNYEERKAMLELLSIVDEVVPENNWEQKPDDVKKYGIDSIVMGSDWEGREEFEKLREICNIEYIYRPYTISTTLLKKVLNIEVDITNEK